MVKGWLKNHVIGVIGLFLAIWTACLAMEQFQWQNYSDLNLRYSETSGKMPNQIAIKTYGDFDELDSESKIWIRSYFNLTSEEYYLYKEHLIPNEMWEKRIRRGLQVNLKTYPVIIEGFYFWKSQNAFNHPDNFITLIEAQIQVVSNARKGQQ